MVPGEAGRLVLPVPPAGSRQPCATGWSWRICAFWTRITACRRSRSASMRNAAGSMSPDMGFSTSFPPRPDSDAPEFYTDPRQQALVLRGLPPELCVQLDSAHCDICGQYPVLLLLRQPYFRQLVGKLVPCICIGYRHCADTGGDAVLGIVLTALREHPHRTAVPPPAQGHSHGPHPQKKELVYKGTADVGLCPWCIP